MKSFLLSGSPRKTSEYSTDAGFVVYHNLTSENILQVHNQLSGI